MICEALIEAKASLAWHSQQLLIRQIGAILCLLVGLEMDACFAVLSDEGDLLVLVDFNSHEYPWFWPFSFPIIKLHYDIKLKIVDTPAGKKFSTQVSVILLPTGTLALMPGHQCQVESVHELATPMNWQLSSMSDVAMRRP